MKVTIIVSEWLLFYRKAEKYSLCLSLLSDKEMSYAAVRERFDGRRKGWPYSPEMLTLWYTGADCCTALGYTLGGRPTQHRRPIINHC